MMRKARSKMHLQDLVLNQCEKTAVPTPEKIEGNKKWGYHFTRLVKTESDSHLKKASAANHRMDGVGELRYGPCLISNPFRSP